MKLQSTLIKIIAKMLKPTFKQLTLQSGWTSGGCFFTTVGNIGIIWLNNLRRSGATTGYVNVAAIPEGVVFDHQIAWLGYTNNAGYYDLAARMNNGYFQINTASIAPAYGAYGVMAFIMGGVTA